MRLRRFAVAGLSSAALLSTAVSTASPAAAAGVVTIYGKDVDAGPYCHGWLEKRTTDGYVRFVGLARGQGNYCAFWLERKRTGSGGYNWKRVSSYYETTGVARSGFHWNGKNAGSRVCANDGGSHHGCGEGAW